MKARALQKHLGTNRCVHAANGCIYVASMHCHDLFGLNVETGALTYALGHQPPHSDLELQKLMHALTSLTKAEREYYWNGADDIENPITLYSIDEDGNVHATTTDSLIFPSVTNDGVLIYKNTHFETKKMLLNHALSDTSFELDYHKNSLIEQRKSLETTEIMIAKRNEKLENLKSQYAEL